MRELYDGLPADPEIAMTYSMGLASSYFHGFNENGPPPDVAHLVMSEELLNSVPPADSYASDFARALGVVASSWALAHDPATFVHSAWICYAISRRGIPMMTKSSKPF